MTESDLIAQAAQLLQLPPYFNVATEGDGQPWNTPIWAAKDADFTLYWSSWSEAVHSRNIARNPRVFLTLFDSTRARGTNNFRCLYLQCTADVVTDPAEAEKAFSLLYPGELVDTSDFVDDGLKRFYRATVIRAWLNCLSERNLTPSTIKMREEISVEDLRGLAWASLSIDRKADTDKPAI